MKLNRISAGTCRTYKKTQTKVINSVDLTKYHLMNCYPKSSAAMITNPMTKPEKMRMATISMKKS